MKLKINLLPSFILWLSIFLSIPLAGKSAVLSAPEDDDKQTTYTFTILKTTGEPQTNLYIKISYENKKFPINDKGVISFQHKENAYNKTVEFYFNNETKRPARSIQLDKSQPTLTLYIDSQEDIQNYKRTNQTFPIEGMVRNNNGEPIEGATVSIQGTGRATYTDEIGLFQIDADFNHPIIFRANGMTNLSLPIQHFFTNEADDHLVRMYAKNKHKIYSSVEKMPSFPGGMKAYRDYLNKFLEYPKKAKDAKIEGVVVVQFIVEKDGLITDARIARHLEASLDSAALRVIREMPLWEPASDYGIDVRCKYSLPVAFRIPKPKPIQPKDSISTHSQNHRLIAKDSLRTDSIQKEAMLDSLAIDSIQAAFHQRHQLADSLANKVQLADKPLADSTQVDKEQATVKAKKRPNFFVRFFRWLFGKDRRERKKREKAAALQLHNDSLKVELNSLDVNIDSLKSQKEVIKKQLDAIKSVADSIKDKD